MLKLDARLAGLENQARAARERGLKLAWRAVLRQLSDFCGDRAAKPELHNQASFQSARAHLEDVYEGRTL